MKSKTIIFLLLFVTIVIVEKASAQDWQFAMGAGAHVSDFSSCSTTDASGNAYFAGYVTGGDFGGIPVESGGVFLVKTTPDGEVEWLRTSGGGNSERQITGISCDHQNNIYVTGYFVYNINFGDFYLNGTISPRMFLVKYSADGEVLWAKVFGTVGDTKYTIANDIVSDDEDNIYVTGHFFERLVFDNDTLVSLNSGSPHKYDIFLTKFTANGDVIWAQRAGGMFEDYAYTLAYDEAGYLLVGGNFWTGDANFGNIYIEEPSNSRKSFITRYDLDGNAIWVKMGSPEWNSSVETTRLTVDNAGNIYGFGNYYGTVIFENDTLNDGQNFLIKLDADGNKIFTQSLSTNNFPDGNHSTGSWFMRMGDMAVDANNNLFLATFFSNQFIFGQDTLVSDTSSYGSHGYDACICKYNEIGFPQWVKKAGGTNHEYTRGISIHQHQIFFDGYYNSLKASFGNDTIYNNSGNNNEDIFLASILDTLPNYCPEINASLIALQSIFCEGDSVKLSCEAYYGSSFLWLLDNQPLGFQYSHERYVKAPGTYSVIVNPNTVCSDTSGSVLISQVPRPNPNIIASPDTILCLGDTIQLQSAFSSEFTYQWFYNDSLIENASQNIVSISAEGWYSLTVNNGVCTDDDSIYIYSGAVYAELNADPDTVICDGETTTLTTPYDSAYQYFWYRNDVLLVDSIHFIDVNQEGLYEVFVFKFECFQSDEISISMSYPPVIDLLQDTLYVDEFPLTIDAGSIEANYQWFFNNDTIPVSEESMITIHTEGKYHVFAFNECGLAMDSLLVIHGTEGILENTLSSSPFSIVPNPNSGNFVLQSSLPLSGEIRLRVFDIFGNQVFENQTIIYENNQLSLSFPELKQGVYFLNLIYNDKQEFLKIIVK